MSERERGGEGGERELFGARFLVECVSVCYGGTSIAFATIIVSIEHAA